MYRGQYEGMLNLRQSDSPERILVRFSTLFHEFNDAKQTRSVRYIGYQLAYATWAMGLQIIFTTLVLFILYIIPALMIRHGIYLLTLKDLLTIM
jgi:hypothetical protein